MLGQESRLRILQRAAARVPGCAYLCAWAALPPAASQPTVAVASSSSPTATRYLSSNACIICIWAGLDYLPNKWAMHLQRPPAVLRGRVAL